MLVLSRKKGEQIRIGDDIIITVQRMSGNRVSLGIEAPQNCRITRGELRAIVEALNGDDEAEAEAPARKSLGASVRPMRNLPAGTLGENRIAPHLQHTLRMPK